MVDWPWEVEWERASQRGCVKLTSDAVTQGREYQKRRWGEVSYVLCMWGLNYSVGGWEIGGLSMKVGESSAYLSVILTLYLCWMGCVYQDPLRGLYKVHPCLGYLNIPPSTPSTALLRVIAIRETRGQKRLPTEVPTWALVLTLGCTLESSGELKKKKKNPVARSRPTLIKSESLEVELKHQCFSKLPRWFHWAAKVKTIALN